MSESSWTNPSAILRDLRFTQGRDVARGQKLTLIEDKPNFTVAEAEDEGEYYSYLGVTPDSSADFSNGADVDSISEMISMMRNSTDEYLKPIEMCRYDSQPLSSLMLPKPTAKEKNHDLSNRGGRNVAIQSLIENSRSLPLLSSSPLSPVYDTEPTDGVDVDVISFPPLPSPSSTKMVAGSTKGYKIGKERNDYKEREQPCLLSSSSSSLNFAAAAKTGINTGKQPENKPTAVRLGPKKYVPTPRSQKIYEKMLLIDSIREMLNECVITVADKQMDLIDERNAKNEELAAEAQQKLMLLGYAFPVKICLPQQRHLTSDDCIVCKTLCTYPDEAKRIQSITLKDISVPIKSTNETENDKIDDQNLNTSLDEIKILVDDSFTEHESLASYSSKESHDFSIVGSDDSSLDDNDFKMNEIDFKVKEIKSDSCGNGNDLNGNDSALNAISSNASNFEVMTKSRNDLVDINNTDSQDDSKYVEDKTSSYLDSDDYEPTDESHFQTIESISSQNMTNKTGAIRKYDVSQSIPNETKVTNEVKQSTTNEVTNVVKQSNTNEVTNVVNQSVTNKEDVKSEIKEEIQMNNNKIPKHTYLRLLQYLKKSVSEDASTRISENHS